MRANSSGSEGRSHLSGIFRALRYRNYRLFFAGQGISLIGTWIQGVTVSWLVYHMTHSAFLLGVVGFSGQIATSILSPFGGVMGDRWNRHRMIVVTQSLFMAQAFAFSALVLTGAVRVWEVIALAMFSGIVNGFDMPARQAFVVEMIEDREDLGNAIALNSSMFNGARLVGPAVAGALIVAVGEGACFLINGLSYLAVIAALLAMRIAPRDLGAQTPNILQEMREGFHRTFGSVPIRSIILLLGLVSLVAMPYAVLLPIFATKILHGDAHTLGFLTAAGGVGALIAAALLASRRTVLGLGKRIPIGAGILGAALIAFSFSHALWLSLLLLVTVGFAMMTQMASSNTIVQTIVDDNMRGRVMSFYTMAFMGTAPFGSLLSGALASKIGAPYTVMIGGAICIIGAGVFAWRLPRLRELIRPIYVEKGLMPEVPGGV